jgi:hypothetical protein
VKVKSPRVRILVIAAEVAVLLALHAMLLRVMADRHIVSSIFAGGSHVPQSVTLTAGFFVIVRLYVYLLLPGVILARVLSVVMERRADSRRDQTLEMPRVENSKQVRG